MKSNSVKIAGAKAVCLILIIIFALPLTVSSETVNGNTSNSSTTLIEMQIGNPMMTINGNSQEIDPGRGTKPMIIGGRTMLPIRSIIEAMGGTVDWDNALQKVTLTRENVKLELTIHNATMLVNGFSKAMDVEPTIINGRTFIPVRFASENLGCSVNWDAYESKVSITIKPFILYYHFNKDEATALANSFMDTNPDTAVVTVTISNDNQNYQTSIEKLTALAAINMADVYASEASFVKRFVNDPHGYNDLSKSQYEENQIVPLMYTYTTDVARDEAGSLKALTHQSVPGGLGYKRDLTLKYLGTDDPVEIYNMMSTPDKMLETGYKIKDKAKLFTGPDEYYQFFLGGRQIPWVKDGVFQIDSKIYDLFRFGKLLRTNNLDSGINAWFPSWDAAIKDSTHIFFTIPTWGVPWIIGAKENANVKNTGRWGIARPPFPYFWGGTWFGIYKNSQKKQLAWNFLKYITSNQKMLRKHVLATGDLTNNKVVNAEISQMDIKDPIVNDNTIRLFEPLSADINGKIITEYDDIIQNDMLYTLSKYLSNKIVNESDALDLFKSKVKNSLRNTDVRFDP